MAALKSALQIGPSGPRVRSATPASARHARDGEKKKRPSLDAVWREARELVWAHRSRLGLGFLLMIVNRLAGLPTGATVTIPVAWVDVPGLEVTRVDQSYRRLADRRWEYRDERHGAFQLSVDDDGLVVDYAGFATRVAP